MGWPLACKCASQLRSRCQHNRRQGHARRLQQAAARVRTWTCIVSLALASENLCACENHAGQAEPSILAHFDRVAPLCLAAGKYARVGTMLAKESVRKRMESEQGISYTEFTYQLLQVFKLLMLWLLVFLSEFRYCKANRPSATQSSRTSCCRWVLQVMHITQYAAG